MTKPSHSPADASGSVPSVDPSDPPSGLRSGTAARLAGLSAATLRIWEHRYGVVSPPRSASGQRTYSMADVKRLRLIRRLTLQGHAIGTVAHLAADALAQLAAGDPASSMREQRIVVIGPTVAQKLASGLGASASRVFGDLAEAERQVAQCGATDVLLMQVASLHAPVPERVLALRDALPAQHVIVVYAFGAEPSAQALREAGVTVCREPVSGNELARLIAASAPLPAAPQARGVRASPRRYSDSELVAIAEMPSKVACECPRHLAEIVALLVGFENYSAECVSADEKDAEMHRQLLDVTSEARTMFEQALARVVVEEGLVVRIGA